MLKKITISGPPGSGKSTVASLLAQQLGVDLISAGQMFRHMAQAAKLSLEEFGLRAEQDWQIDRELDARMLKLLRQKRQGVFDGRLTGYLAHANHIKSLKIYLDARLDARIQRIMKREKKDYATVKRDVIAREHSERSRYMKIYGVDVSDTSFFDLVIDSSQLSPEEVVEGVIKALTSFS